MAISSRQFDNRVLPGSPAERSFDMAIHLASIVPLLIAVLVVGRPHLLLAPVLLVGPVVFGAALAGGRDAGRQHRARAIDTAATTTVAALVVYVILTLGSRYSSLSMLLPVGAICLLLLLVNWVLFTVIAANRARYGELFDTPWVLPIPAWLRGIPRDRG